MTSATTIRRAEVHEAVELSGLALRSKAMWGYGAAFLERCRDELSVDEAAIREGEVWVAEAGGRLTGLLEIVPRGEAAEVRLLFVDPQAAGTGTGRALWRHAELRAEAHGATHLMLDADPNAVHFYERMGARIVGESPSGSIPGRMLPRMARDLSGD